MSFASGIDVSGYSQGKSALAVARRFTDRVTVIICEGTPFSQKHTGDQPLARIVEQERTFIRSCSEYGRVLVDIPLDLQSLSHLSDVEFAWQLTRRPVDYALRGMPPLADRIGAAVARFQHLLAGLPDLQLGRHLFETYPALILDLLGLPSTRYKGVPITYQAGGWQGGERLSTLAHQLDFSANEGIQLTDDEFDAVLCALSGVADAAQRLEGDRLRNIINAKLAEKLSLPTADFDAPQGYSVLCQPLDLPVHIQKQPIKDVGMLKHLLDSLTAGATESP